MDAKLIAQYPNDGSFATLKHSYTIIVPEDKLNYIMSKEYELLCLLFKTKHGVHKCMNCNVTMLPLYPPFLTTTNSEDCKVFVSKPTFLCNECINHVNIKEVE